MEQAMDALFRRHSQAYPHDHDERLQVLDADMTGLPCGAKAELATKGYFSSQGIRNGRQQRGASSPHATMKSS